MSEDPTYEFRKGEGWVPTIAERLEVVMNDGVRVMLIMREPQKGERYFVESNHWGKIGLSYFRRRARGRCFKDLKPRQTRPRPDKIYCTVVPV